MADNEPPILIAEASRPFWVDHSCRVDGLVAGFAERQAIFNDKPEIGKVGERFDVMRVEVTTASIAATAANISVTPKDVVAPSPIIGGKARASALGKSTIPKRVMVSAAPLLCARTHGNAHLGARRVAVLATYHRSSAALHRRGKLILGVLREGNSPFGTGTPPQASIRVRRPRATHAFCLSFVETRAIDVELGDVAPLFAFRASFQTSSSQRSIFVKRQPAFGSSGPVDAQRGVGHG